MPPSNQPEREYGDAFTRPFWRAAARHELLVQRCVACGGHQFYPRLTCLACDADHLEWTRVSGSGTVYSVTTVHLKVAVDLEPPYQVALVTLDEGPRLLTNIVEGACRVGDRVTVTWKERPSAPPFPVFRPVEPGTPDHALPQPPASNPG